MRTELNRAGIRALHYDPFDVGQSVYSIRAAEHLADWRAKIIEQERYESKREAIRTLQSEIFEQRYRCKLVPGNEGWRFQS